LKRSTKNSLIGRIADNAGLNEKFHRYKKIYTDPNDDALISPVEVRVVHIGNIDTEGMLISKRNKKIRLKELIGEKFPNNNDCSRVIKCQQNSY
jgi:hypothetical protein